MGGALSGLWRLPQPNVRRYEYDIDKANAILDGLGWRDRDDDGVREDRAGNPITFTLITYTGGGSNVITVEIIDEGFDLMGVDAQIEVNFFHSSGALHIRHPNQPSPATDWGAASTPCTSQGARSWITSNASSCTIARRSSWPSNSR